MDVNPLPKFVVPNTLKAYPEGFDATMPPVAVKPATWDAAPDTVNAANAGVRVVTFKPSLREEGPARTWRPAAPVTMSPLTVVDMVYICRKNCAS